jgi:hypothetical protein
MMILLCFSEVDRSLVERWEDRSLAHVAQRGGLVRQDETTTAMPIGNFASGAAPCFEGKRGTAAPGAGRAPADGSNQTVCAKATSTLPNAVRAMRGPAAIGHTSDASRAWPSACNARSSRKASHAGCIFLKKGHSYAW